MEQKHFSLSSRFGRNFPGRAFSGAISSEYKPNTVSSSPKDASKHYGVIEGDMKMNAEEIAAIKRGQDPNTVGAQARGLKRNRKWPGGVVPYTLHSSVSK